MRCRWNAAYAAHQEEYLGSLETGKLADFVILDQNVVELADADNRMLLNTTVLATVFDGRCVFTVTKEM